MHVRVDAERMVILITFDTDSERFDSNYERNRFFRELYGWTQTLKKNDKKYTYKRDGLLTRVPHIRISESVFMIPVENKREFKVFFDEWHDKVRCEMINMMIREKRIINHMRRMLDIL